MRFKSDTFNILVGASVIGVIAAYMIYGYLSDRPGAAEEGYSLIAKFRSIDGIAEGSSVMLAGLPVGKVARTDFDPNTSNAILTMTMREDIRVPLDSAAMIVSDGVFGSKFVKIAPGGDLDMLEPGDQFEYVQDSVVFEELLQKVILAAEAKRRGTKEAEAPITEGKE